MVFPDAPGRRTRRTGPGPGGGGTQKNRKDPSKGRILPTMLNMMTLMVVYFLENPMCNMWPQTMCFIHQVDTPTISKRKCILSVKSFGDKEMEGKGGGWSGKAKERWKGGKERKEEGEKAKQKKWDINIMNECRLADTTVANALG